MSSEPNHTKVLISQIWHYKSVEKKENSNLKYHSVEEISSTQTYPIKFIWFDRSLCTTAKFEDITIIETTMLKKQQRFFTCSFSSFCWIFWSYCVWSLCWEILSEILKPFWASSLSNVFVIIKLLIITLSFFFGDLETRFKLAICGWSTLTLCVNYQIGITPVTLLWRSSIALLSSDKTC